MKHLHSNIKELIILRKGKNKPKQSKPKFYPGSHSIEQTF